MSDAAKNTTDPIEIRYIKLQEAKDKGMNPYIYTFDRKDLAKDLQEKYKDLEDGAETEDSVTVAGRITAMRNSGMFIDLTDSTGKIQIFSHKDSTPEDQLEKLDVFDLGDIIGITGTIRRTPRGELSIRSKEITLLTKALHPLPEKYHGLQDIEQRYRQRYLDLIATEDSLNTLRLRSRIITLLRRFLEEEWDGVEVETPILHGIMGGASAKPFETFHNALDSKFYLRVATELHLKRLIVGGFSDCVFEIGRIFRNEGISIKHNPEFTSVELYKAYTDYNDMMRLTEELVEHLALKLYGTTIIKFGENEIDVKAPWKRATMIDLVKEETGVDFLELSDRDAAAAKAQELGVHVEDRHKWGEIVLEVFEEKVEPKLIQPIHVTDHPLDVSPLAKNHRDNPLLTERFESFINAWEIANAFTELNDPQEQRKRFEAQVEAREAGDEEAQMLDEDFVTALEVGMPPTGGWGMGIDRLVMILTNSHNIRDVICFPTLRPEKKAGAGHTKEIAKAATEVSENSFTETAGSWKNVDENEKRYVIVVNGKEEETGRILNAVGHLMAGMAAQQVAPNDRHFVDYETADGQKFPSIGHYPVIALKAKNSNQVLKTVKGAIEKGIPYSAFTKTMLVGGTQPQLDATKEVAADDHDYTAVALFGDTEELKELTGKFSLYR